MYNGVSSKEPVFGQQGVGCLGNPYNQKIEMDFSLIPITIQRTIMSSTQTKIVKKVKLVIVETLESCTIDSTRVNGLESEPSRLARIERWNKQRADVAVRCWECSVGRCFRTHLYK